MNRKDYENNIIACLLDELSEQEKQELEQELKQSPALAEEFARYQQIRRSAAQIAAEQHRAPAALQVKVMEELEQYPRFGRWRFRMSKARSKFWSFAPTAALAASTCIVLVLASISFLGKESAESFSMIGSQMNPGVNSAAAVNQRATGAFKQLIDRFDSSSQSVDLLAGAPEPKTEVKSEVDSADLQAPSDRKGQAQLQKEYLATQPSAPIPAEQAAQPHADLITGYKQDLSGREAGNARFRRLQPVPSGAENYGVYEENGRMIAAAQPLSTFSIDVDTGSYTNARRFLRSGQLPPPESVRIEEFINYFDYQYPADDEKGPFALSYEIAPSPLEPEKHLLKLGLRTFDRGAGDAGWNLVFLIDVSGSMADSNKLPLLKEALKILVHRMRPVDRIAIVTYAGQAGLVLDSTSGNDRRAILAAIDSMYAGGSTNGSGGIALAYEVAARSRIHDGVNRVILATDGDFNVGVTSFSGLLALVEEKRATGITLTTLGVGTGNYNEHNIEQLANKGNGNYFYLDSLEEARRVLSDKLVANMNVVAKDVKLQIEFNPQNVKAYRLIGYDNRRLQHRDFNNDAVDAGEIGSGHTVTVLYELILTGSAAAAGLDDALRYQAQPTAKHQAGSAFSGELAFLKIRYKEPNSSSSVPLEFALRGENKIARAGQASRDFRFAAAVSYFGHLLRRSSFAGNYSFAEVRELALGAQGDDVYGQRREFAELAAAAAAAAAQRSGVR